MKRKILIVTERRADYSKLRPIIKEISKSKKLDYFLIVTGTHILKEYGHTINDIKKDGFKISGIFPMFKKDNHDTGAEMSRAFGRAVIKLSDIIENLKPDIILAGFDIGANFGSAIIGAHMNIIVAHVEGGELTGTIDDSIRHATTKFAHLHFATSSEAVNRIIKMGENPRYVFNVGNTSLDGIKNVGNIPTRELEKKYGLDLENPFIILLQHTVTSEVDEVDKHMMKTIQAIKELNIQCLIIYGNADAGSKKISHVIKNSKIKQISTVPFNEFINLLRHCSVLVGNSSCGIIETPFLGIPSVNIGTRQEGRLRSKSVIDASYDKEEIKKAIRKAIYDKKFRETIKKTRSPYGNGQAAKKIVRVLEKIDLKSIPIQKKMMY